MGRAGLTIDRFLGSFSAARASAASVKAVCIPDRYMPVGGSVEGGLSAPSGTGWPNLLNWEWITPGPTASASGVIERATSLMPRRYADWLVDWAQRLSTKGAGAGDRAELRPAAAPRPISMGRGGGACNRSSSASPEEAAAPWGQLTRPLQK
jgi:hypothetical protein